MACRPFFGKLTNYSRKLLKKYSFELANMEKVDREAHMYEYFSHFTLEMDSMAKKITARHNNFSVQGVQDLFPDPRPS